MYFSIKLKYGTTEIAVATTINGGGDTRHGAGIITAALFANADTAVQFGFLNFVTATMENLAPFEDHKGASDNGTATEDSTGALVLDIRALWGATNVTNAFTSIGGYATKIVT